MAVLDHLEPKNVFSFFEEIAAIPHGSGNTKAISDYLADFAFAHALEYHQDAMNNIIIIKEATPGYEKVPPVILQGHMDMVCDLAPDCTKDMAREGLDLACTEDYVYAKGTTLGGDDGIGVALALAILASDDLAHPRLEVVITTDEEIGMLGALGLDLEMKTAAVGGAAYLVAQAVKKAEVVAFADLGMEAIYEFEVQDMPVTVAVDSSGESVHITGPQIWQKKIAESLAVEVQ